MWLMLINFILGLAGQILGSLKSKGTQEAAALIADVEAGIAAFTKARGTAVTLDQVQALRVQKTWPDVSVPTP